MEEDRKRFSPMDHPGGAGESRSAKYTLAVPSYVAPPGQKLCRLRAHAERFHRKDLRIEPGNNGNRMIGSIIGPETGFGLGIGRCRVERTRMLSEVDRAIRKSDWMRSSPVAPSDEFKYHIEYLSGGDDTLGPLRRSTIYTDVRSGYLAECPNVGTLLKNLEFTPEIESQF